MDSKYVQRGGCFYYLAPKCLYRGEYKSVLWMDRDEVWILSARLRWSVVLYVSLPMPPLL